MDRIELNLEGWKAQAETCSDELAQYRDENYALRAARDECVAEIAELRGQVSTLQAEIEETHEILNGHARYDVLARSRPLPERVTRLIAVYCYQLSQLDTIRTALIPKSHAALAETK